MVLWVFVILVLGLMVTLYGAILPIASDCLRFFGVAIMLISVGIATRMTSLRKKGDREAAGRRIAELEARVRELEGAGGAAAEEKRGG